MTTSTFTISELIDRLESIPHSDVALKYPRRKLRRQEWEASVTVDGHSVFVDFVVRRSCAEGSCVLSEVIPTTVVMLDEDGCENVLESRVVDRSREENERLKLLVWEWVLRRASWILSETSWH